MKTLKKKVEAIGRNVKKTKEETLMRAKKLTVITLTLLLTVGPFVQPVAADQPIINRLEFVQSFDDQSCGFPVTVEITVKLTQKIFVDRNGTPSQMQFIVRGVGPLTNPDNEKFLILRGAWMETLDLLNQTDTLAGVPLHLKTAQGSPVVLDRGRIVFDVNGNVLFEAGKFSGGGFPPIPAAACAELL
jgi:hypothetical protein